MGQLEKCRKDKFAGGMNLSDGQRDDPGELILCEQINVIIDESNAQDGRITVLENATVDHGDLTGLAGVVDHMEEIDLSQWWPGIVPALMIDGTTSEALAQAGVCIGLKGNGSQADLGIVTEEQGGADPSSAIWMNTGFNTGTGKTGGVFISTGVGVNDTGDIQLYAGQTTDGKSGKVEMETGMSVNGNSGDAKIITGASTNANSGDILLAVGNANNGTRGKVDVNAAYMVIPRHTTANAPVTAEDGAMYFDLTTNKFRGWASGAWADLH